MTLIINSPKADISSWWQSEWMCASVAAELIISPRQASPRLSDVCRGRWVIERAGRRHTMLFVLVSLLFSVVVAQIRIPACRNLAIIKVYRPV